jgi:hypothetical protein
VTALSGETSSPNNFRIKTCLVTQRGKVLPQELAVVQLVFKFIPTSTEAPLADTNPPPSSLPPNGHQNASQSDCSTETTVQTKSSSIYMCCTCQEKCPVAVLCTGRWMSATHRGAFRSNGADFKRHALRLNWHWLTCLSEHVRFSPNDTPPLP